MSVTGEEIHEMEKLTVALRLWAKNAGSFDLSGCYFMYD